jgi:septin family protein
VCIPLLQDTPGYGDDPDIGKHITMMLDFLEKQNLKYLQQESSRER